MFLDRGTLGILRMASVTKFNISFARMFSLSSQCNGKRNFRKFMLHRRGTKAFQEKMKTDPYPDVPYYNYGVRETGYKDVNTGKFVEVPEMIPEIVVPDLTDCKLKPYVSYRVKEFDQPEFTAQDLFIAVYRDKIAKDFKEGKLDEYGNPKEPSPEEAMTPEEAKLKVRQTGSDMFKPMSPREISDYPLRY
ncbi:39S ribosomal protein L41, mitochondrial [Macrosteles quadrilineatus]|uniref:39S ribosomal protein L41, mitochondrial n=1 Tax=Macrosteles quadrilineatus TaxID=74068 RepID=UPI0023E1C396|nr:39S ribosomal protein L41, mitochondrial [Macrosteles quadrilineatus]